MTDHQILRPCPPQRHDDVLWTMPPLGNRDVSPLRVCPGNCNQSGAQRTVCAMRSGPIQRSHRECLQLRKLPLFRFPYAIVLRTPEDLIHSILSLPARPPALPLPRRIFRNAVGLRMRCMIRTRHRRIARYLMIRFIA
jgi:hypothetical protein